MKGSTCHKLDKLFLGSTKTKLTEIRVGYGTEFARVAIYTWWLVRTQEEHSHTTVIIDNSLPRTGPSGIVGESWH